MATATACWSVWGLDASVTVTEPSALDDARAIVETVLADVDRACSRFRDDAELSSASVRRGRPTPISPMLATLVDAALAAARASRGAVDPTVGQRLVALGYDRDLEMLSDPAGPSDPGQRFRRPPVAAHRAHAGMVTRRGDLLTVPEGVVLDLGATAKAVAADLAADVVASRTGAGVLVDLGGDIATRGGHPAGGWQILVDDGPGQPAAQIAVTGDCGVSQAFPRASSPPMGPWSRSVTGPTSTSGRHSDGALWALGRGTGLTALMLMTVSITLGVWTRSGRPLLGLPRFAVSSLHRSVALGATLLVVLHVTTMVVDPYAQIDLVDVVLPFRAGYAPLWVGLGTLALDLLFVVVVTGLLRHRLGPRTFRVLHLATYLLRPVAFVHALGSGTDTGHAWMIAICAACAVVVVAAVVARLTLPEEFAAARRTAHANRPLTGVR